MSKIKRLLEFLHLKEKKKTIKKWPYWCWNCRLKIEKPPEPDARGDLICPSCGLIIPEP